ncbi:acyltransferase [Flavobacteriales bacterium]|nr:acyltransferase [Flavobacteriales bacterium]
MYKFIFKILGWKINEDVPKEYTRCVLVGAPHTSNWDFFYAIFLFKILKIPYKFTIKSEWFKFPFNLIIKPLGGIPINTKSKTKGGNVNIMADLFKDNKEFAMGITPEATRSIRTKWKSGFYHLAKDNNLPICLGYLDYKTRTGGIAGPIFPSENKDADMKKIMAFYKNVSPKNPENFSLDHRYI